MVRFPPAAGDRRTDSKGRLRHADRSEFRERQLQGVEVGVGLGGALSVGESSGDRQTVDEASYPSATSRSVTVTMSAEVWVDLAVGENAQNLSADFALIGGTTGADSLTHADAVHPIAVDGIPSDRYPGTATFTLRFDQAVAGLASTTTQLALVYTAATGREIKATAGDAATVTIAATGVPVIGPGQTSTLVLTLSAAAKRALEAPKMRGKELAGAAYATTSDPYRPSFCRRPPARSAPLSPIPSSTCPLGWIAPRTPASRPRRGRR